MYFIEGYMISENDIIFKKLLKFMCLAVLQDARWAYKNPLYFCILGKNNLQFIKIYNFY